MIFSTCSNWNWDKIGYLIAHLSTAYTLHPYLFSFVCDTWTNMQKSQKRGRNNKEEAVAFWGLAPSIIIIIVVVVVVHLHRHRRRLRVLCPCARVRASISPSLFLLLSWNLFSSAFTYAIYLHFRLNSFRFSSFIVRWRNACGKRDTLHLVWGTFYPNYGYTHTHIDRANNE